MNSDRFMATSLSHGLPKLDNHLSISWHDTAWVPLLNSGNVMEYFSERTNPFYDRTCNNENLKMQRLGPEHLQNMIGLEYCLLHVQEPYLYVIRKQHRHSPTQVTPIADYYISNGTIYQAPDLASVIGSRLLTSVHLLQSAFDEGASFSQYHPSKGYWWEFKNNEKQEKVQPKEEAAGSNFQRCRVDTLIHELVRKFPPKVQSPPQLEKQTTEETGAKVEVKTEIKTEKPDPPATTTSAATTSTNVVAQTTTASTVTPSTATTTAVAPLLPPPPPPAPSTTAPTPAATVTAPANAQRSAMKPPPEKRPRLM